MIPTEPIVVFARDEIDTELVASTIAELLAPGEVLHLHGGLGAGKTTFVRGLARGLGLRPEEVSSPTFVRLQRYDDGRRSLVHVDAHRIERAGEAAGLEIEPIAEETSAVVAIEWPERLGEHAPPPDLVISIDAASEGRRIAIVDRRESRKARRLAEALRTLHGGAVETVAADRGTGCPICGRPIEVSANASSGPFCSERCRGADLSRWFRGDYAISRPLDPETDADFGEPFGQEP